MPQPNTTNTVFNNGLEASKFLNIPHTDSPGTTGLLQGALNYFPTDDKVRYWDGTQFQDIATDVDLSGYYTKVESDNRFVSLTGSYANPSWITSLAYSKITGAPTTPNLQSVLTAGNTATTEIIIGDESTNLILNSEYLQLQHSADVAPSSANYIAAYTSGTGGALEFQSVSQNNNAGFRFAVDPSTFAATMRMGRYFDVAFTYQGFRFNGDNTVEYVDDTGSKPIYYGANYDTAILADDDSIPSLRAVKSLIPGSLTFANGLRSQSGTVKLGLDLTTIGTTNEGLLTEQTILALGDIVGTNYSYTQINASAVSMAKKAGNWLVTSEVGVDGGGQPVAALIAANDTESLNSSIRIASTSDERVLSFLNIGVGGWGITNLQGFQFGMRDDDPSLSKMNVYDEYNGIGLEYNDLGYSIKGILKDNWIPHYKAVKDYVTSAIGGISPSTLQSVTNGSGNNQTTNALQVTDVTNLNTTIQSTALYNYGAAVNAGGVGVTNGTDLKRMIEYSEATGQTAIYNDTELSSILLREETGSNSGILISTRMSGSSAINSTDFTTLGQVTALIPSTPNLQAVATVGSTTTTSLTANSFIKSGGTSAQFLKADGSVDSNTYLTSGDLSAYELLSNKSTSTSLGTSNILYPTQNAVKTYVDGLDVGNVKTTGTQTISGTKTFNNAIKTNLGTGFHYDLQDGGVNKYGIGLAAGGGITGFTIYDYTNGYAIMGHADQIGAEPSTTTFEGVVSASLSSGTGGLASLNGEDGSIVFGTPSDKAIIKADNVTGDKTLQAPNASGTIALTSDLSGYVTTNTNQTSGLTGNKTWGGTHQFTTTTFGTNFFASELLGATRGLYLSSQGSDTNAGLTGPQTAIYGIPVTLGAGYGLRFRTSNSVGPSNHWDKAIDLIFPVTADRVINFPDASGTAMVLDTVSSPPSTSSSTGKVGTVIISGGFRYEAVATDSWVRSAVATF